MGKFERERLEHLIVVMERVAAEALPFDMRVYSQECGTPACALGHAACDPEFVKLGLTMGGGVPVYKDNWGISAGRQFFGLSRAAADYLFSGVGPLAVERDWMTPRHVIVNIRRVLANAGRAPGEG